MTLNTELLFGKNPAAGGYQIERSLRFNSSDSAYLSRTPSVAGNRKTWTWAGWVKRSTQNTTNNEFLFESRFGSSDSTIFSLGFANGGFGTTKDALVIFRWSFYSLITTQLFRDTSAWYHIVLNVDTTQATASDRIKLYVNGVRITAFSSATYPALNEDLPINTTNAHIVGGQGYFNGYLADIHFIDGQALDPTSFTEVDATTGQLVPIAYTGSYGTNGFHLPFSDNSTAAALGTDTSGARNDWNVNNINGPTTPSGYTADYAISGTAPTYTPYGTSYGWQTAFDGNLTTGPITYITGYSELNVQNKPSWLSKIRVYIVVYYAGDVSINGIALGVTSGGWKDITSLVGSSGTLNTVRISSVGSNYVRLGAIELDGVILNDGGSVFRGGEIDSLVDTPTNGSQTDTGVGGEVVGNYCTWNPVNSSSLLTPSNGNLELTGTGAGATFGNSRGSIALTDSKYYWETVVAATRTYQRWGIAPTDTPCENGGSEALGNSDIPNSVGLNCNTGSVSVNGSIVYTGSGAIASGAIVGHAFDGTSGKYWISVNGVWLTGNPATNTTPITTVSLTRTWQPAASDATSQTLVANFGQRPFAYPAPSGFKALCTTNLPDPQTITTSGSYTGNGVVDGPFVYLNGVPTAMTVNGNAVTFGTEADRLSNGFKVRTTSTTYNQNAVVYNYSITSTGDPFKRARAQSNP